MRSIGDHTWWIGTAVLVATAGGALAYALDPILAHGIPLCLFHLLTGLHCPGCGCLRAAHALVHGRFADALAFNSLFVVGVPLTAVAWVWNRCRPQPIELRPMWAWWLVAVLVAFGVLRNVPVYPFSLLAPHVRAVRGVEVSRPADLLFDHHQRLGRTADVATVLLRDQREHDGP